MSESGTYFDQVLTQLNIVPAQNQQQKQELQQLLFDKLSYPSTQLALIHMNANRLGVLDLRHEQEKKQLTESKELNKDLKYCRCCALPEQPSLLSLCTSIKNIKNLRGLIRLLFITYFHAIVLLLILFFVYCLYAIISNVKSCNYDPANLNLAYNSTQYMRQISSWVFQVSLLSNISCMTSQTSYDIQCWLAVLAIILLAIVFTLLKYRKLKITGDIQKKHSSVQKLSIFIQNMPVNMTKSELEQQLQKYQKQLNKSTKEGKKQIKIAKLNFAAPFYLSSSVFSHPQISKIEHIFKKIKKQFINLVKSRRKSPSFSMVLQDRQKLYREYEQTKKQRIEIYKRVVLQNLVKKADEQKGVLTAPAFVTFQSSYNAKFIIQNNTKQKTIFESDKCFHFINPNNGGKMRAEIKRPAKPEEILWMNLGQQRSAILKKKVIVYIISIIFLAGTAAGLYFFQQFNFEQSVKNRNSALLLSFVVSIVILVISYIITAFLFILTKKQRNITYIHEEMSLNHKANIFQICHFVLIPLIFHLFFTTRYTGIVSLSQTVFFLGIQNAFVMPALKLLDIMYFINRVRKWWFSRPIKKLELNQFQLNQKFEYIQLIFAIESSFLVRSLIFTFFYAALQPIIVVFTILGLFAMHWIEKYCILRRCTRPISASIFTRLSINRYLAVGPIIFAVGCLIWPYYIKKQFVGLAPSIVAIVISVILCVIPFQKLVKKFMERSEIPGNEEQQILYSEIKDNGQPEYERMNYLTSNEAILQKNQQKMRRQQQNGTMMQTHIQIFQKLISSQGLYNTFSSIGHAQSNKNTNMDKMQEAGKSNRIKEIEQVVYRTSNNQKRALIKQILENLRNNINRLKYKNTANDVHADANAGPSSSTHIIKLDSN